MLTVLSGWASVNRTCRFGAVGLLLAQIAVAQAPFAAGERSRPLERLFTPPAAPVGMYEVYVSDVPIERLAAALRARDAEPASGAWELRRLGAGDAFGAEGAYDRARLALLVRGGRIKTVRGSLRSVDGAVTAYTLLSPYPDPELTTLSGGTMTIVFHVPRQRR